MQVSLVLYIFKFLYSCNFLDIGMLYIRHDRELHCLPLCCVTNSSNTAATTVRTTLCGSSIIKIQLKSH